METWQRERERKNRAGQERKNHVNTYKNIYLTEIVNRYYWLNA